MTHYNKSHKQLYLWGKAAHLHPLRLMLEEVLVLALLLLLPILLLLHPLSCRHLLLLTRRHLKGDNQQFITEWKWRAMLQQDKENHQNKWLYHCNVVYRKTIYRGDNQGWYYKTKQKNHVCGNQFWNRKMIWEYFIFSGLTNKIIKKITYQRNIIKILEYRELVVQCTWWYQ